MSVRETLELDVSPALQALQQFGSRLEGVARGFGDDLQQALESALQGLPVVDVKADATSVTQEVDQALAAADGEKEVDGDATAVESSVTEAVAAADGTKEVDGDAIGVESAITEAVGAADGVKEITADASGVTEAIEQAVADADVDLSTLPAPPAAEGAGGLAGLAAGTALVKNNVTGINAAAQGATQNMGRLGSVGSQAMSALSNPLTAAAAGVAAVGALGAVSVREFASLEKGIAEVATLLGDIPDSEVRRLTDGVRELSTELGMTTDELVPALYNAISAGVPAENVIDFLRTSGKAAIAGVTDVNTAVNGLTNVVNAFGLEASQTEAVADSMFSAVQGGKTTFDELSSSMFQVAPAAAASGVSFQEVNAALATLTSGSTPTRVAATQIRAALVGLQRPSEELDAIFQELGFENAELAIQAEGLGFALDAVTAASGGSNGKLQQLLGSVEAVAAAQVIAGTGADKYAQELERQGAAAGATEAAFETMTDTLDFSLGRLMRQLNDLRLTIGQALLPAIETLVAGLAEVLDIAVPVASTIGGRLADSVDTATTALRPLITALGAVGDVLGRIGGDAEDGADGFDFMGAAVGGLTRAVINAVPGVGPLANAFAETGDALDRTSDSADRASGEIGTLGDRIVQAEALIRASVEEANAALAEQMTLWAPLYDEATAFVTMATGSIPQVTDAFRDLGDETNADILTGNLEAQIAATDEWTTNMTNATRMGLDNITALMAELGPTQSAILLEQYRGREGELETHLEEMAAAQQRASAKINETALRGYLTLRDITGTQADAVVATFAARLQLGVPAQEEIEAVIRAPQTKELEALAAFGDFAGAANKSVTDIINETEGQLIAENLDRGLGAGLSKEQAQAVWRAARYAQAVKDKINEIFGIESPSTEMMDTGRNLVLGLSMGIENNAGLVDGAMAGLASDVLGVNLSAGGPTIRDVSVTVPVTVSGGMTADDGRAVGQAAGQAAAAELARMMRLEAMVA